MKTIRFLSALTGLLLCAATGLAAAEDSTENRGRMSLKDHKFARSAAQGGLMEVKAGGLARTQGTDPAVKQLGEEMVADHGQAGEKLKEIAAARGATLPGELTSRQQREIERLSRLSGQEFDRAYAKLMVEDHQKDLKAFRKAAETLEDADLRAFAAKTALVIEQHLNHAKQLAANLEEARRETPPATP